MHAAANAAAFPGASRASSSRPPVFGRGPVRSTPAPATSMSNGNPFGTTIPVAWRGNTPATPFGSGFGSSFVQPTGQASAGVSGFGTFGTPAGSFSTSSFVNQGQLAASSPFGVSNIGSFGVVPNANARTTSTDFHAGGKSGLSGPTAAAKQATTGWFPLGGGVNLAPKPAQPSVFATPLTGTRRPFQTAPVNPFLGSKSSSSVAGPQPVNPFATANNSGNSRLSSDPRQSPFAPRAPAAVAANSNPFAAGNGTVSVQKNAFTANWFRDKQSQTNQTVGAGNSSASPFGRHMFHSDAASVSPPTSHWQFMNAPARAAPTVDGNNSATGQCNNACTPLTGAISENTGFRFTFTPSWQPNAELSAQRTTPAPQHQKIFSSCFSYPKKSVFDFNHTGGGGAKSENAAKAPLFAFKSGSDWNTTTTTSSGSDSAVVATGFDVKLTTNTASMSAGQDRVKSLVALPDVNPYGAGSFGAGSLEVAVNAALNFEHTHASTNNFLSAKPKPKPSISHANLGLPTRPINCAVLKSNRRMIGDRNSLRVASIRRVVGGARGLKTDHAAAGSAVHSTQRASEAQSEFSFKSSLFRELGSKKQLEVTSEPLCKTTTDVGEPDDHSLCANEDNKSEQKEQQNTHPEPTLTDSEDKEEDKTPLVNLACPILTNPLISTVPELSQLQRMSSDDLAQVDGFAIRSAEFGEIEWPGVTDVRHLNLDEILEFSESEVVVYPDEYPCKPEVGLGLNKRAILRLSHIYPSEKTRTSSDNEDEDAATAAFVERLKKRTADLQAQFLGYEPAGGVWKFEVKHF